MFKFSASQKLALKSWFHAAIATELLALGDFLKNAPTHFTVSMFLKAAAYALLAPMSRFVARKYSEYAIKYPWLKPLASTLAKRAMKSATVVKANALIQKAMTTPEVKP